MEKRSNNRKNLLIICVVMLCLGLAGSLVTLLSISASERVYTTAKAEYDQLSETLWETDPDAAALLVKPSREYAAPLSAKAITMLFALAGSVLLFFIGGGLLITKAVHIHKLERIQQSRISLLTFSALCIALAVVLSQIRLYRMPQGGSVTAFSMLPIVLVGYWYGVRAGLFAGATYGVLRLLLGAYVAHPIQFILDYPLAYAALGCFCLFRGRRFGLQISYLAGATGRFLCSFAAGIVFFSENAPEGQNVLAYSAIYQLSYLGPEIIVTLIVISMPTVANAIEQLRLARVRGKV